MLIGKKLLRFFLECTMFPRMQLIHFSITEQSNIDNNYGEIKNYNFMKYMSINSYIRKWKDILTIKSFVV